MLGILCSGPSVLWCPSDGKFVCSLRGFRLESVRLVCLDMFALGVSCGMFRGFFVWDSLLWMLCLRHFVWVISLREFRLESFASELLCDPSLGNFRLGCVARVL